MAVSWEKIMLHENYLHTFRSSYYFLMDIFFWEKIPLISLSCHFWHETVQSTKYEKSVLWNDHSNVNEPRHTFHFSHVFVLQTYFTVPGLTFEFLSVCRLHIVDRRRTSSKNRSNTENMECRPVRSLLELTLTNEPTLFSNLISNFKN